MNPMGADIITNCDMCDYYDKPILGIRSAFCNKRQQKLTENMLGCSEGKRRVNLQFQSPEFNIPDQTIKADAGKEQLSLVPMQIMRDIAIIRKYGNDKYGDSESWKRVDPVRYMDAALRHMIAFVEDPKSKDEESGHRHLQHLACNIAFLCEMFKE